jgi:hypothetical protein
MTKFALQFESSPENSPELNKVIEEIGRFAKVSIIDQVFSEDVTKSGADVIVAITVLASIAKAALPQISLILETWLNRPGQKSVTIELSDSNQKNKMIQIHSDGVASHDFRSIVQDALRVDES